ncbi:MAG: hypothetical protein ICV87_14660 [Gemmatimonadetes bacterium]|nr:hypothetical protein [Gemmatimonadota bacterium]
MRKVIWTAAVLALCAAPAAAQQIEKSPFTSAPAREQADLPAPKDEPAQQERTPSLRVTPQQLDETIRAVAEERGQGRQQIGSNFWYTVAAIALGIIIASLLLD